MRKLLVVGAVVAVLGGIVDVAARSYAEGQIEKRAQDEAGPGADASASIKSFPFVGRLLVSGSAGDVNVTVHHLSTATMSFSAVRLHLADLHLDKSKLLGRRKVELTSVDRAVVTLSLDSQELTRRVGAPVTVSDGQVRVDVRGRVVTATPSVVAGALRIEAPPLPAFTVRIPQGRLVACDVRSVVAKGDRLELSCESDDIPPALVQATSRAA